MLNQKWNRKKNFRYVRIYSTMRFTSSKSLDLSLCKNQPNNTDTITHSFSKNSRGLYFLQKSLFTGKRAVPSMNWEFGSVGLMTLLFSSANSHTSVTASLNKNDKYTLYLAVALLYCILKLQYLPRLSIWTNSSEFSCVGGILPPQSTSLS